MNRILVTIALGATVISAPLVAQQSGGRGQRDQTRAEAQQRADMMFQMIDANHDGTVTKAEAQTALAQFEAMRGGGGDNGGRGGGRMQRMLDQLFATSPSITQPQLEALMLARFDAQDLNHDGTVTAAEREQARAARQAAGGATAPVQAPAPAPVKPQ
jgi:hypothetical protein